MSLRSKCNMIKILQTIVLALFMCLGTQTVFSQTDNRPERANNNILCFGYLNSNSDTSAAFQRADFKQMLAKAAKDDTDEDVFLYRYVVALLKESGDVRWLKDRDGVSCLRSYNQGNVGACVGNATALCIATRAAYEIVKENKNCKFVGMGSADGMYGLVREAGGWIGKMGDGANGVDAADAVVNLGSLWMIAYSDKSDLSIYSDSRASSFGYRGVGEELKKEASVRKFMNATKVNTATDAWTCIGKGIPINVCSNYGFNSRRDSNGVCSPAGTWYHSMAVTARRTRNGAKEFLIQNSWGDDWNGGPYAGDMPFGSFWVSSSVLNSMLSQNDSYGYYDFDGFPSDHIDKIINGVLVWLWLE